MPNIKQYILSLGLAVSVLPLSLTANAAVSSYNAADTTDLTTYVKNLGSFLGFDLAKNIPVPKSTPRLFDAAGTQLAQTYVFNTMLGALPVNAVTAAFSQFLPGNYPGYGMINSFANASFSSQNDNYGSPAGSPLGLFTVSSTLDQKTYQADPVTQGILNILTTPDYSFCMKYGTKELDPNCNLLHQRKVAENVIGKIPGPNEFFTYSYVQPLLSELNSNALIGPMIYDITPQSSTTSSAGSSSPGQNTANGVGLVAQNQLQAAGNFVLYASGAVNPATLPAQTAYNDLYNVATNVGGQVPADRMINAQATLSSYFSQLRTYAAQNSVGLSNLYYILSKRFPQAQGNSQTSQTLSELVMATRRIYDPNNSSNQNPQWLEQINSASPAAVQKEIAILLSEINYQLYLSRQQEERLLLTNSIMLLQQAKTNVPELSSASSAASADSNSSSENAANSSK